MASVKNIAQTTSLVVSILKTTVLLFGADGYESVDQSRPMDYYWSSDPGSDESPHVIGNVYLHVSRDEAFHCYRQTGFYLAYYNWSLPRSSNLHNVPYRKRWLFGPQLWSQGSDRISVEKLQEILSHNTLSSLTVRNGSLNQTFSDVLN